MDTSDLYPTATLALEALEEVTLPSATQLEAMHALRDFIRVADEERAVNNTCSGYRAHLKEGDSK